MWLLNIKYGISDFDFEFEGLRDAILFVEEAVNHSTVNLTFKIEKHEKGAGEE